MALAVAPRPTETRTPSASVQESARRLFAAGWLDRLERGRPYIDAQDHPHYRWIGPSESGIGTHLLDFNVATREVRCSCKGFTGWGFCKHSLCLKTYRIDRARIVSEVEQPLQSSDPPASDLVRRVAELERQVAQLTEWLTDMGGDVATLYPAN